MELIDRLQIETGGFKSNEGLRSFIKYIRSENLSGRIEKEKLLKLGIISKELGNLMEGMFYGGRHDDSV